MLRTPEPKDQAKLLVKLLGEAGLTLGHQASLNIVAQLAGHRNWNTMQAAGTPGPVADALHLKSPPDGMSRFISVATEVVSQADSAGCDDDLTVTSASAVRKLEGLIQLYKKEGVFERRASSHNFTADDVLTLRPDLTEDEAAEVVDIADQRFDATVGVSWEVLEVHANESFKHRGVIGRFVRQLTGEELGPVVVDYRDGTVYLGTLEELRTEYAQKGYDARIARKLETHLNKGFSLDDTPVVYMPDGTFIDIEDFDNGHIFNGISEALHNSISNLREEEQRVGKTYVIELPW